MTEQRPSPDAAFDAALSDAAEAFAHWRRTRRRERERTPAPLRAQAVALLEHRRPSHVARALGISPATLARWAARPDGDAAPPDAFVPLPDTPVLDAVSVSDESELIVRWPHGTQLVARGPIPAATLAAILTAAASVSSSGS